MHPGRGRELISTPFYSMYPPNSSSPIPAIGLKSDHANPWFIKRADKLFRGGVGENSRNATGERKGLVSRPGFALFF